jgi:DNA-binding CsgD family transcriptional regulator
VDEREKPGATFSGDDPGTWHPDGKARGRSIARQAAVEERERIALDLYIRGATQSDIARAIDRAESSVSVIIRRALERRAAQEGETVDQARALYLDRLALLLNAHLPLALGSFQLPVDPDTGERPPPPPPDVRSAEFVLKVIDKMAAVQAKVSDKPAGVEIHVHGTEGDRLRAEILDSLDREAEKRTRVDAELGAAGTSTAELIDGVLVEDQPPPRALESR